MKILIVEDERITRDQLSLLLKEWGYDSISAADGNEAWDIIEKEPIRMVITDLLMPGSDGIELCKKIRGKKSDFYTYILVITGMSDQKSLYDAMFAGADDFVVKPWHNAEVRARLRTGERIIHLEDELKERIRKLEEANLMIRSANERMIREVAFMSRMQSTLLPGSNAKLPGIVYSWKHRPHSVLAGDGMNIFRLDENNLAVFMVDVASAGEAASFLLASLARQLVPIPGQPGILKLLSRLEPGYEISPPARVLSQLNQQFPIDLESGKFFTVIYGLLNLEKQTFTYASAGAPAPLHLKADGGCEMIFAGNPAIGKSAGQKFDQFSLKLEIGDRLIFVSDGFKNVLDPSSEPFGNRRLKEVLCRQRSDDLDEFVDAVYKAGQEWAGGHDFQDDVSLLALKFTGVQR
ncbi:MAG: phosphoserine phosphatase RsbU/P [Clostridiales bacterium]|nr:phosphoserine phosphatase RsbU/P [Clostridiales bacterium]MDN5281798.1 phosphoserine phosphatase RsbU/P [Candidatus Ozemobacter sp.]